MRLATRFEHVGVCFAKIKKDSSFTFNFHFEESIYSRVNSAKWTQFLVITSSGILYSIFVFYFWLKTTEVVLFVYLQMKANPEKLVLNQIYDFFFQTRARLHLAKHSIILLEKNYF